MNRAPSSPIEVLVVDDSPFMRMTIQRILGQDSGIKVVDIARDGREGIEKLQQLKPQVITMDVEMPVMDGLRALEEIMRWQPTPVIVLSAVTTEGAEATLRALDLGAFDVVAKPSGGPGADLAALASDLSAKIKAAAQVNPLRLKIAMKQRNAVKASAPLPTAMKATSGAISVSEAASGTFAGKPLGIAASSNVWTGREGTAMKNGRVDFELPKHPVEIVAIGTSTGGPSALQTVLPVLPANFPVPVIVAQHMPQGFTGPLAQRLNGICRITVREAVNGEFLRPSTVYIAPAGKQIQVQRKSGQLAFLISEDSPIPTLYHPSVDVMLMSLAKIMGKSTLGVIMTGMGNDGAKGIKEVKDSDGFVIAEAEESCVVYGMPRVVVEAGLANRVLPLQEIGKAIVDSVMRR